MPVKGPRGTVSRGLAEAVGRRGRRLSLPVVRGISVVGGDLGVSHLFNKVEAVARCVAIVAWFGDFITVAGG